MTNELATVNDSSLELLPPAQPPSLAAREMLVSHAEMMHTAYELAQAMCKTELVPARFRGKPEDGAAAILFGAELGLNPIQSLQRVIPIHGMPTIEARTMVALLKSRGYKIKILAQSDESVTVLGVDLQGEQYESTWTMQRAIKAGYVPTLDEKTGKYKTNSKGNLLGNEKYLSDPQAMLKAKAQAEVCRDMAPDVLLGISYTSEELTSEQFDNTPVLKQHPRSAPRSAPLTVEEIFATADIPAETTATADDTQIEQPDDVPEEPPTAPMNRKMHAMFRDAGLTNRDDRLTVTAAILGYRLDTSASLTKSEASKLIDTLEQWAQAGQLEHEVTEILNSAALAAENQPPTTEQENQ